MQGAQRGVQHAHLVCVLRSGGVWRQAGECGAGAQVLRQRLQGLAKTQFVAFHPGGAQAGQGMVLGGQGCAEPVEQRGLQHPAGAKVFPAQRHAGGGLPGGREWVGGPGQHGVHGLPRVVGEPQVVAFRGLQAGAQQHLGLCLRAVQADHQVARQAGAQRVEGGALRVDVALPPVFAPACPDGQGQARQHHGQQQQAHVHADPAAACSTARTRRAAFTRKVLRGRDLLQREGRQAQQQGQRRKQHRDDGVHLRGVEKGALPAKLVAHHQPAQQQR